MAEAAMSGNNDEDESPIFITDRDKIKALVSSQTFYNVLPMQQRPPHHVDDDMHGITFVDAIVCHFDELTWLPGATYGCAFPQMYRELAASFFLKLIQWAIDAEINVYVETLYDGTLAAKNIRLEKAQRVFIVFQTLEERETFASAVDRSLNPKPVAKGNKKAKTSKNQTAGSKRKPEDIPLFDRYVSKTRIDS